jgi:hypothetical protein
VKLIRDADDHCFNLRIRKHFLISAEATSGSQSCVILFRKSSAASQMAYSRAFWAFWQPSKWAAWEIIPHPRTPIRTGSWVFFMRFRF